MQYKVKLEKLRKAMQSGVPVCRVAGLRVRLRNKPLRILRMRLYYILKQMSTSAQHAFINLFKINSAVHKRCFDLNELSVLTRKLLHILLNSDEEKRTLTASFSV